MLINNKKRYLVLLHTFHKFCLLFRRLDSWLELSECQNGLPANANEKSTTDEEAGKFNSMEKNTVNAPEFPLLPGSKGFCISLKKAITAFKETINEI